MRAVVVVALALAALLRAGVDWYGSTGQGVPYRLASIGQAMEANWPKTYLQLVTGWQQTQVPILWDPIGQTILSIPLALLLAFLGGVLWLTRAREARR